MIKDHVLLPWARCVARSGRGLVGEARIAASCRTSWRRYRTSWLLDADAFADPATQRAAYVEYLVRRLDQRQAFVQEAIHARQ